VEVELKVCQAVSIFCVDLVLDYLQSYVAIPLMWSKSDSRYNSMFILLTLRSHPQIVDFCVGLHVWTCGWLLLPHTDNCVHLLIEHIFCVVW
jgi:hypothetical protein